MYIYISIGPLRRLIYKLFVDYPPMNIYQLAAPTVDILFICGLPSDVLTFLDYPPNRLL